MHKRVFHKSFKRVVFKSSDGVERLLPIDQFPVKDFNLNIFGHPKSDLTLLIEATEKATDNFQRFTEFAARIHMLRSEPKNNKSVEELIHDWRPAWIQTVTEEQKFSEWYYEHFDKSLEDSNEVINEIQNEESNDSE